MVDAIPALTTDKAVKLFEEFHVFTRTELESRAEIQYEIYAKAINIEAKAMIDITTKQIIRSDQIYDCTGRFHQCRTGSRCDRCERTA